MKEAQPALKECVDLRDFQEIQVPEEYQAEQNKVKLDHQDLLVPQVPLADLVALGVQGTQEGWENPEDLVHLEQEVKLVLLVPEEILDHQVFQDLLDQEVKLGHLENQALLAQEDQQEDQVMYKNKEAR